MRSCWSVNEPGSAKLYMPWNSLFGVLDTQLSPTLRLTLRRPPIDYPLDVVRVPAVAVPSADPADDSRPAGSLSTSVVDDPAPSVGSGPAISGAGESGVSSESRSTSLAKGALAVLAGKQFAKVDNISKYVEPEQIIQTNASSERLRHSRKWCPAGSIVEEQLRKLRDAFRAPTQTQGPGYLHKQGVKLFRPEDPYIQLCKFDRSQLCPYGLFLNESFCFDPFAADPLLRSCHRCTNGKLCSNGLSEARRVVGINDILLLFGKDIYCNPSRRATICR